MNPEIEDDSQNERQELQMPYVTSIERMAREDGREEASFAILLRLLSRRFGEVPDDVQQKIRRLPLEKALDLSEALLNFESIAELEKWLVTSHRD